MEKLMSYLQPFVQQVRPRIELSNKKQFTEAYNIPIQKDSDVDDFDTKLDKTQLKYLLKHLQSLKLDDIPIVGGPAGIKIRSAQDKDAEIRSWAKENAPDLKLSFGQGSIGKGGGVKISESTQELMVAALVLNKVKSGNIDEAAAIDMIEDEQKRQTLVAKLAGSTLARELGLTRKLCLVRETERELPLGSGSFCISLFSVLPS